MNAYVPVLPGNVDALHWYEPGEGGVCRWCGIAQDAHVCPYFHMVPLEEEANKKWRLRMLKEGLSSKARALAVREMCRRDILFWMATFLRICNEKEGLDLWFVPFTFQCELILVLQDSLSIPRERRGYDLVVEKSREMAATWSGCAVFLHRCLFCQRQMFLALSRKEDLVDKPNNSDAIFWKFDYLHDSQPSFLRSPRYRDKRTAMHAEVAETKSGLDGESTNEFAGVGGRRRAIMKDEFSKMKNQDTIAAGTRDVSETRWFFFTPQGSGNYAARIAHNPNFRKLTVHWSLHPVKRRGLYRVAADGKIEVLDKEWHEQNPGYAFVAERPKSEKYDFRSPWYDAECRREDNPMKIAQELDISYLGSQYTYYDPREVERLCRETALAPFAVGELDFDRTAHPGRFIRQLNGRLRLWIHPQPGGAMPDDRMFGLGVDVAEGTGASNSVISVVDFKTGEKVAEFADPRIDAADLATYAVALARWFAGLDGEGCRIIWEAPGPGISFRKQLFKLDYLNIFWRKKNERQAWAETSKVPGWYPTPENRKEAHADYRRALVSGRFVNRSERSLRECLQYVWVPEGDQILHVQQVESIDPTGAGAQHGDFVVADMLACKLLLESDYGYVPTPADESEPSSRSIAGRREIARRAREEAEIY